MKKILSGCIVLFVTLSLNAQLSTYYFEASNGSYTPLSGGTQPAVSSFDDGQTGLLPIGFTFQYNGTDYTQLDASTNGFVKLGSVIASGYLGYNSLKNNPERPILAPLFDDLSMTSAASLQYSTSGTAPNRVFTLQWSSMRWSYNSMAAVMDFQLKLYETTNRVEFIYNPLAGAVHAPNAIIGITALTTGNGQFMALTNTSASPGVRMDEDVYITTKPAAGQTYAFFKPLPCNGTPAGGSLQSTHAMVCSGSPIRLSVSGSTIATGLSFQWQSSADGTTWQHISGATDTSYTATQTLNTYYRRAVSCGANTAYSTSSLVTTGVVSVVPATIPFLETFENTWVSNCGIRELPSVHWKNTPVTGSRSWRREDDAAAAGWNTGNASFSGISGHFARFRVRDEFSTTDHGTGSLDLYVDCSPAGSKELRFKHFQGNPYEHLSLFYSTDGGATFTSLGTVRGTSVWKAHYYNIPSTAPNTIIRFQGRGEGYSGATDVGIDDVAVLVVTCTFPTGLIAQNVGQTSATFNWNAVPGAVGYEYVVNQSTNSPATGTSVTTNSIDITGLTGASDYYLHVRAKCGNTDFSSWSTIAFATSVDCNTATVIQCGSPLSFSIADGSGDYELRSTDPAGNCGLTMFGKEKLLRFSPAVSGTYSLRILSSNASYPVDYYLKDASAGCAPVGWTCLGSATGVATLSLGNLTAGKDYFIMLDLYTIVNGHSETVEIVCPAANSDCQPTTISPASVALCTGSSQVLTASGGSAWQWYRNGVAISGGTSVNLTVNSSGTYSLAATNGTCVSLASNKVTVTTSGPNVPVVTAGGPQTFCSGGNVPLATTAVSGITFQWQKDGVDVTGATSNTYTVHTAGSYTVKATNTDGCSVTSTAITITVNPIPAAPVVTATAGTTICQGETVTLNSSGTAGNQWYKDGTLISGAQGTSYAAGSAGTFTATVTEAGCTSAASVAVTVAVTALPPTPSVTASGNVLSSSAATGNQWYYNNTLINGATGQHYTATAAGNYKVRVTASGCSADSPPFNYVITAMETPGQSIEEFSVYPNPAVETLFLRNPAGHKLVLQLSDMQGRKMQQMILRHTNGTMDLRGLSRGVYQLSIRNESLNRTTSTLIIIK